MEEDGVLRVFVKMMGRKEKGQSFLLVAKRPACFTAARFEIGSNRAANYNADSEDMKLDYEVVSCAFSELLGQVEGLMKTL